ncbi:hypothetical protein Tco_0738509, partial [Tanacetum coccineum]
GNSMLKEDVDSSIKSKDGIAFSKVDGNIEFHNILVFGHPVLVPGFNMSFAVVAAQAENMSPPTTGSLMNVVPATWTNNNVTKQEPHSIIHVLDDIILSDPKDVSGWVKSGVEDVVDWGDRGSVYVITAKMEYYCHMFWG